jgi:ubiquinone biosynthesis protein Coq4
MSMFDPFKKLKLASAFLGVPEDAARTDATLELSEAFGRLDLRTLGLDTARLLEQDGVRALYDSRYLPQPEPLDRLLDYGEGTLGFEVARYLRTQNHQRLVGPPAGFDFRDAAAYLALRVRMTHPIVHVLTEYDAGPLGELALQSFYVGQFGTVISGVMISSGLLAITRDMPDKLGDALSVVSEAYQRGQNARALLGIAWEELWSAQAAQLRELANLSPRTSQIALLNLEPPPPPPAPSRSASGLGLGLASPRSDSSSRVSTTSRTALNFGGDTPSVTPAATPSRSSPVAETREGRPEPRKHEVSQSSLLASFMALAEQENKRTSQDVQEAEPELVDPSPARAPKPPPPPPRINLASPQPPAPQPSSSRAPSKPQPGFSIEESDPKIQPAINPDDPDFF